MGISCRSAGMRILATGLCLAALLSPLQAMADAKTVDGVVVKIGVVSAAQDGNLPENFTAPLHKEKAIQRLLVNLSRAENQQRIDNAIVRAEVKNPGGTMEKKILHRIRNSTDYSELFRFDRSGNYLITISIQTKNRKEPLEAVFTENIP
ncbi:MAG: hypothetical protein HKL98_04685 [Burkholderiales bacterium]|nr:hypothetical protein [Burkholderiales bacterium]